MKKQIKYYLFALCIFSILGCGGGQKAAITSPNTAPVDLSKGSWGMYYNISTPVPPGILSQYNTGLVGVLLGFYWTDIEATKDTYDWTLVDSRISEIKTAGKKITLSLVMSAEYTPTWLTTDPAVKTISLLDTDSWRGAYRGDPNSTYCTYITGPVYWDPISIAQKTEIVGIMGNRYANDPSIEAVLVQFINWWTDDWEIAEYDGTFTCTNDDHSYDGTLTQSQDWLDAGYTTATMLYAAQQILGAYATAFPNQVLILPIHLTKPSLDPPPDAPTDRWTYLAERVVAWADTQTWANRFFIARHHLVKRVDSTGTPDASTIDNPSTNDDRIWKMVRDHYPRNGMQEAGAISNCNKSDCSTCKTTHGTSPCGLSALTDIINVGLTYRPYYIQFWRGDSQNTSLYDTFTYATNKMNP